VSIYSRLPAQLNDPPYGCHGGGSLRCFAVKPPGVRRRISPNRSMEAVIDEFASKKLARPERPRAADVRVGAELMKRRS
jgi:hypothetical protein